MTSSTVSLSYSGQVCIPSVALGFRDDGSRTLDLVFMLTLYPAILAPPSGGEPQEVALLMYLHFPGRQLSMCRVRQGQSRSSCFISLDIPFHREASHSRSCRRQAPHTRDQSICSSYLHIGGSHFHRRSYCTAPLSTIPPLTGFPVFHLNITSFVRLWLSNR